MRNHAIHSTIDIKRTEFTDKFALDWVDEYGGSSEHVCFVYGFENAIRVANGIAHGQCEYVTHPASNPDEVTQ